MLYPNDNAEKYLLEKFLFELSTKGFKLSLERMQRWSDLQGNPHKAFPIIHVAGTNGKGSVCAMLEAIYRNAGYTTGLFTSPHLVELGERIQVNRKNISHASLLRLTQNVHQTALKMAPINSDNHPTFFEYMTMIAFEYFKAKKVDIAIIETGLGGRLDSTNIIHPNLSVITTIGLDHTEWLGETLGQIAAEKAGIIKPGTPVIVGDIQGEALDVITQKAEQAKSPLFTVKSHFGEPLEGYPQPSLTGNYQRINAATAYLAAEVLASTLPVKESNILDGLNNTHWAGRWQYIDLPDNKAIILDTTHNEAGLSTLEENLDRYYQQYGQKPEIVTGSISAYRAQACIPFLAQRSSRLFFMSSFHEKALNYQELSAHVPESLQVEHVEILPENIHSLVSQSSKDAPMIITGSIYLIGDILKNISKEHSVTI